MNAGADDHEDGGGAPELHGGRTAIVGAHGMTIVMSALIALIALGSVVFGDGPRGSAPLGVALTVVSAVTVWVGWSSLRTFREEGHVRLLWLGAVGFAWMGVTLVAASV